MPSPDPESGLCTAHAAAVSALVPTTGPLELAAGEKVKADMVTQPMTLGTMLAFVPDQQVCILFDY